MIRKEAIELCLSEIKEQPIIAANGFISRDLFNAKDRNTNFYMIGSMGLASSIGLGVALKTPKKKIFVFDWFRLIPQKLQLSFRILLEIISL